MLPCVSACNPQYNGTKWFLPAGVNMKTVSRSRGYFTISVCAILVFSLQGSLKKVSMHVMRG